MKLFLTCSPAFYKINLYNQINAVEPIKVVFTEQLGKHRNSDFISGHMMFDYVQLPQNVFLACSQFLGILLNTKYDEVIIGGWDILFYWIAVFFSPKKKNAVVIESTIYESKIVGINALLKRIFLKRISKAYVCGIPHFRLVENLGFKGNTIITKGVGIFNYINQPKYVPREEVRNFIYVGRLTGVKNLSFIIERFNNHPELNLQIVGFGELEESLKKMAKSNISFIGAVNNKDLPNYYQKADVFVLPSLSETWGLVVEEALNNGLPVMLSDRVGCHEDLVNDNTGIVFSLNKESFEEGLCKVRDIDRYNRMRKYISRLNFKKIEQKQVECYLS